jgi:bifunctional ADP-heptose synthase (sugar kinase/adenylyltransferase)
VNFAAVKDFRILMVGDAIIDRYVFVRPLGKSIKESVLSVGYEREEEYRGGVWAAAAHLAEICSRVDVLHGPRVVVNTRFIEGVNNRKLFTLHEERAGEAAQEFDIGSYDAVIVADFGHGTMSPALIDRVSREARFLAVNAQTNSTNFGFNLVTKYQRADFVVIDELEARLAAHDRDSSIEDVILKLGYRKIIVTLGSRGAIGFDGGFHREKAMTDQVVDTMGAGDAFLAVAAPFAAARCSIRDLVQIGNAAGAAKVGVLGHQRAIRKEDLVR